MLAKFLLTKVTAEGHSKSAKFCGYPLNMPPNSTWLNSPQSPARGERGAPAAVAPASAVVCCFVCCWPHRCYAWVSRSSPPLPPPPPPHPPFFLLRGRVQMDIFFLLETHHLVEVLLPSWITNGGEHKALVCTLVFNFVSMTFKTAIGNLSCFRSSSCCYFLRVSFITGKIYKTKTSFANNVNRTCLNLWTHPDDEGDDHRRPMMVIAAASLAEAEGPGRSGARRLWTRQRRRRQPRTLPPPPSSVGEKCINELLENIVKSWLDIMTFSSSNIDENPQLLRKCIKIPC